MEDGFRRPSAHKCAAQEGEEGSSREKPDRGPGMGDTRKNQEASGASEICTRSSQVVGGWVGRSHISGTEQLARKANDRHCLEKTGHVSG